MKKINFHLFHLFIFATMLHFKENIKLIRSVSKQTQLEFSKKFDVTVNMLKSYESGKANPDKLFQMRVCEYAGVSFTDFEKKALTEKDINIRDEKDENSNLNDGNLKTPNMEQSVLLVELKAAKTINDLQQQTIESQRRAIETLEKLVNKLEEDLQKKGATQSGGDMEDSQGIKNVS